MDHSIRRITGNVDLFKAGTELNEEARVGTQRRGYLTFQKKGTDGTASLRSPTSGTNYLRFDAIIPGVWGNDIELQVVNTASALSVELSLIHI